MTESPTDPRLDTEDEHIRDLEQLAHMLFERARTAGDAASRRSQRWFSWASTEWSSPPVEPVLNHCPSGAGRQVPAAFSDAMAGPCHLPYGQSYPASEAHEGGPPHVPPA